MGIQTVMCALAIEILLKSFNAVVTSNHDRLDETYKFDKKNSLANDSNAHDLMILYESLPLNIQNYLFDSIDIQILKSNKDLFLSSRYAYEANANNIHHDDLIKLTACLICKMVYLYSKHGSDEPFITQLDIDGLYFSQV